MGLFSKKQPPEPTHKWPAKQCPKTKEDALAQLAQEDPERVAKMLREILSKK